jgi:signal transduction histidine kinase
MHLNVFFFSSSLLSITSLFLIAIVIRYGNNNIHRIWSFHNSAIFVWATFATLLSITTNKELSDVFWRIGACGVSLVPPLYLHLSCLLTKRKIGANLIFSYLISIFFSFLIIKTNLIISAPSVFYHNNFFILSIGPLYAYWFLCWFIIVAHGHLFLIKFYLSNKYKRPNELKYFIIYFSIGFFFGIFNFLNPLGLSIFEYGNLGLSIALLSAYYYIFKHQLLGIEIIYRKGFLYSILLTTLSAIYLSLVMLAEWIFRGLVGYQSIGLSLSLAIIIALLFNPLKNKLQSVIDKIFLSKTPQEIAQENVLLKQELEHSERLKTASTLALGLAHEIRNPLTTIKTFAEYLPEKYKDNEFVSKFSKIIPSEVERINSIIKQLLDFSKPSPPTFKETNICGLIQDTVKFLNSEFLKHKIEVAESFENAQILIKIDPSQIRQVILNLLLNAMEALPNGGRIEIETKTLSYNQIAIEISDNGTGIPKENIARIFDPFFTTKDAGTGLGLSVTHQIIKNHKGLIEVKSEIGKGTTFIIKLPLVN